MWNKNKSMLLLLALFIGAGGVLFMANKYCNLQGGDKIKDTYTDINTGFDGVDADVSALNTRVDTIITTPAEGVTAQEIIDARKGEATLRNKIDGIDAQMAEKATKTELNAIADGSPKDVYNTLIDLQSAYPTGTTGIYVVSADGNWYFWNGSAWTAGGTYQSTGIADSSITPEKTTFFDKRNYFDFTKITTNAFWNNTSPSSSGGYYYSDYIPVKPGEMFIIPYNVVTLGGAFDSNKNPISGISRNLYSPQPEDMSIFIVAEGWHYVIVNGFQGTYEGRTTTLPSDYMMVRGAEYPDEYIPYTNSDKIKIENLPEQIIVPPTDEDISQLQSANVLWGKTLATAGDSITEGVDIEPEGVDEFGNKMTYGYLTAKRNSMNFLNYGVSGSTMQNIVGKNGFSDTRYLTMATELDYLTIFFGWNDHAYGVLGTIDDVTDQTFYGAWNKVLPYLIQNYPTTKIGLIVPFGTSPEYRQAVRDIGDKWGIPYLDLYGKNSPFYYGKETEVGTVSSVATWRRNIFQANGAHPSAAGHAYLSTIFENFLRSL